MRILLFGSNGQLGRELQKVLSPLSGTLSVDKEEVDFTDLEALSSFIKSAEPTVIVNAGAYTDVDRAEVEVELAQMINVEAPRTIAAQAEDLGAILIHFSTDYVFDGEKGEPYRESDTPNPINKYGETKLEGEIAVTNECELGFIIRTSWLYGDHTNSFPWKVLNWAHSREIVRVVDDQIGSPTWNRDLAEATFSMIDRLKSIELEEVVKISGIYHLAGLGGVSRFDWAKEIVALDPERSSQKLKQILPAKSNEFPNPALRPRFSVLDCSKAEEVFGLKMKPWMDSLRLAMEERI